MYLGHGLPSRATWQAQWSAACVLGLTVASREARWPATTHTGMEFMLTYTEAGTDPGGAAGREATPVTPEPKKEQWVDILQTLVCPRNARPPPGSAGPWLTLTGRASAAPHAGAH